MLPWEFISQEPIHKGWSGDQKYCVTTADGTRYLLRTAPKERSNRLAAVFEVQQKVAALGIPMCHPIAFEIASNGTAYMLQTWIDGQDAEDVIPQLSASQQYAYGLTAGRILKQIHTIPAPTSAPDWSVRFNAKIDRKIKLYQECSLHFEGAEQIIAYIDAHRHLLHGRPQSFQHGDYHIGNMMLENGKLIIIDFDRYDYGDPWEEFNRIVWCAQCSPLFASGILNGYFNDHIPIEFWKLLALYIGSNTLSSVAWAIPFGETEIQTMLHQAHDVLCWYDHMQNPVPSWYGRHKFSSF